MNGIWTIVLLFVSNIFMTLAWYGHLKLQSVNIITDNTPLYLVILMSWMLALPEYCCQVSANRIGFDGNGGPFSLVQLKIIQEVISITVFALFSLIAFKGQVFRWNHVAAFACLILAVYFVFKK
ncbi:MAG: DMT family protein [Paludibacteraceae bacterium]|nr:DMT family protein [Paludibacteraceae bacterium]